MLLLLCMCLLFLTCSFVKCEDFYDHYDVPSNYGDNGSWYEDAEKQAAIKHVTVNKLIRSPVKKHRREQILKPKNDS